MAVMSPSTRPDQPRRHCVLGEPDLDPERTVAACHAAGRLALANHAPTEAVRYLELAEATARAGGLTVDAAFMLLLGTAQQQAGHFTAAARSARTGYERSTGPVERARLWSLLAQSMVRDGRSRYGGWSWTSSWRALRSKPVLDRARTTYDRPL